MSDASLQRELAARWAGDVGHGAAARAALDGLLTRHREPHRRYHTAVHVAHVLRAVARLAEAIGADAATTRTVRLAAWYHDAVYDPRAAAGANEEASAALAERELVDLGEPAALAAAVARLVRLTAGHQPAPDDRAGALLIDADLGVLAADPATYQAYVNGVRAEYAHVDDDAWRAGRAAVLRGFLDRPRIHHLDVEPEREARARANLAAELSGLTGAPPASVAGA